MHSTINDIDLQARQGSIAAIIQILNEHFSDANIRTARSMTTVFYNSW
ncbi:MAG: hypothetical protein HC922_03255 [Leptolyngbyaceae cyanobacterium SM2_3_12]|nr:hypothetical protein [Leptolyngbyaceae cyanobacterium SM2_3_12]